MTSGKKQYGLLVPKKTGSLLKLPRPSVFGEESDSGPEEGVDWVKKSLKKEHEKGMQKKQTKLDIEKALEQDPTVYQYDEVYDKMEQKKEEVIAERKKDRKPRYIQSLLQQAERRKKENERRVERQVQREREAEGDEFKDKEEFVTSSYKARLEELWQAEEEEKRQDAIDELTDVSKQSDLSGFYRHLYRQKMGEGLPSKTEFTVKEEPIEEKETSSKMVTDKPERHYRKRKASSSSESGDGKRERDADSDLSESSSGTSSSSDTEERPGSDKVDKPPTSTTTTDTKTVSTSGPASTAVLSGSEDGEIRDETENRETNKALLPLAPPRPSIWEKRTVGPVLEGALQRYYARKAAKMASSG